MLKKRVVLFRQSFTASLVFGMIASQSGAVWAEEAIQFNTDVLDVQDRGHIDLSQFSQAGYVMPGTYALAIQVNKSTLPEQQIQFLAPDNDPKGSRACLTTDLVTRLGLTNAASKKLQWWHNGQCLDPTSLPGMSLRGDIGAGVLYVSVPQAYLEYVAENWDPPSRWDEGVPGVLLDYNVNGQINHAYGSDDGGDSRTLSGNGTAGANLGAWRFRADWQGQQQSGDGSDSVRSFDWNRYYMYRAIPSLRAKLTMGEDYLTSDMFDSFRFTGASLISSDNMLPPNLRGYAPEVTGVAKTNAKVTVSQQGRVISETMVAAGPFRIQDLNNAVSGTLDVKVKEQDGTEQTYQINTSNVPYLTRPGMVRYKIATGKPSDYDHHSNGPVFGTGEFSWGINNGWSLYGGLLGAGDYNALSLGIGRDLLALGAISFDVTESSARLPDQGNQQGGSYRVSYSKRFDETNSQVTFAGYRFSEREFMTMTEYLDARYKSYEDAGNNKEMYTISFNQQLTSLNTSLYVNYSRQTYWDNDASTTWNTSISRYFDLGRFKNLSVNLSAFRTENADYKDDGVYASVSIPWGETASFGYDSQYGHGGSSHNVSYDDRIDNNNTYHLSAGTDQNGRGGGSGYFTHEGDIAEMTATAAYQSSDYSSAGIALRGGMTATQSGAALHRISVPGGTRMMLDTDGVGGVPVYGNAAITHTNMFGKAVLADVSSYYRNSMNIDMNSLSDDVDATRSVVQGTLTEGAIGYRKFGVIAGKKALVVVRLSDGSVPPFGATVSNKDKEQTGLVSDDGSVWLTGMKSGEVMAVSWDGAEQCQIRLPSPLPLNMDTQHMLLPCVPATVAKR